MTCVPPRGFLKKSYATKRKIGSRMAMELLVTSDSPQTAARNLDTSSIKQQIAVVATLMSAYAKATSYAINELHTLISKNHPYVRWLMNDEANMDWLKDYGVLLLVEHGQRTGTRHKGSKFIYDFVEDFGAPIGVEPKMFLNRAWDERFDYRFEQHTPYAYRKLMSARWNTAKRSPQWGDRMPPIWYLEDQLNRQGLAGVQVN